MSDNIKLYSVMEGFELININDGDRYNYLGDNDLVIDSDGYLKLILFNEPKGKLRFFSKDEFIEIPWQYVKKIGSKTIIIDVDNSDLKRSKL